MVTVAAELLELERALVLEPLLKKPPPALKLLPENRRAGVMLNAFEGVGATKGGGVGAEANGFTRGVRKDGGPP
jgi:hypothetical protein